MASRPILIYWVCNFLTRSSATLPIVSNSALNVLPKVFVAAPAYLKYSRIENLLFSSELVKDSAVVLTVRSSAEKEPIELILPIKFLCRDFCAAAAAAFDFVIDALNSESCL